MSKSIAKKLHRSPGNNGYIPIVISPFKCFNIISSVKGVSSLKGHSLHFTLGLSHLYVLNSFLQTGEYPDFPVLLLVHLFAYKSVLPLNTSIKIFTFSSLEIAFASVSTSFSSIFPYSFSFNSLFSFSNFCIICINSFLSKSSNKAISLLFNISILSYF